MDNQYILTSYARYLTPEQLNKTLVESTRYNNADDVHYLIENGADVNTKGTMGNTALMFAAQYNYIEFAELFFEKRSVQINEVNDSGETALMLCVRHNYIDMATLLISKGAEVKIAKENGETALDIAARHGQTDCVNLLILKGALEVEGSTIKSLMLAIKYEHVNTAEKILSFMTQEARNNFASSQLEKTETKSMALIFSKLTENLKKEEYHNKCEMDEEGRYKLSK